MDFIVEVETTWEDFVDQHPKPEQNKRFIYRGQLNGFNHKKEFERWPLISSFNREHNIGGLSFARFIGQHLNDAHFKRVYGKYEWVQDKGLVEMDLVNRLLYLQHYGISTCFLDFTYNPWKALYFAIAPLRLPDISTSDADGNRKEFGNAYFSIYKLNCDILVNNLCVKELKETTNEFYLNYHDSQHKCYMAGAHIALLHNDYVQKDGNKNIELQEGCFVLYDNWQTANAGRIGLELYLEQLAKEKQLCLKEPFITIYNMKWDSVFKKRGNNQNDTQKDKGLFNFLKENSITGEKLFTDHQGLKNDLDFFYESL